MVTVRSAKFDLTDWEQLPEGFPAELIDGELVKEPSPVPWHQTVVLRIYRAFFRVIPEDRLLVSPIDVVIDRHNVLQPDVIVLREADALKGDERYVALPMLAVEVLSPSTSNRDRAVKTRIYLEAGVNEVWLADPRTRTVEIRTRAGSTTYSGAEKIGIAALRGLDLTPQALFSI